MDIFKPITCENVLDLAPALRAQAYRVCDNTLGAIYQWRNIYRSHYALVSGMLCIRATYDGLGLCYTVPVGGGDLAAALDAVCADANGHHVPLRFCVAPAETLPLLKKRFGDDIVIENRRDWADYVYTAEQFLTYSGNKLHTQRNHVNRFYREHPDAVLAPISGENIPLCHEFLCDYSQQHNDMSRVERNEVRGAMDLICQRDKLSQDAACLMLEGRVIALSIGEVQNDTLYVHVEKARLDIPGAYTAMAQAFVRCAGEGVRWVNREDDAGDPGLRESKLRYRPVEMMEKFYVSVEERRCSKSL